MSLTSFTITTFNIMYNEHIQLLAVRIKELHEAMKPSEEYDLSHHLENANKYTDLVDNILEETKGEANAFYTDPILCDDFTSLTGHPVNSLTYNELYKLCKKLNLVK